MLLLAFKPNLTETLYILRENLPQLKLYVVEDVNIYGITSSYDVWHYDHSQMLANGPKGDRRPGMEVK